MKRSLPNDVARCIGKNGGVVCDRREMCARYVDRDQALKEAKFLSYFIPLTLSDECESFIEIKAANDEEYGDAVS